MLVLDREEDDGEGGRGALVVSGEDGVRRGQGTGMVGGDYCGGGGGGSVCGEDGLLMRKVGGEDGMAFDEGVKGPFCKERRYKGHHEREND